VPTDFYQLLEIDQNATDDDIRRAYRRLARELHPDANGGDPRAEERFKEVTVAYETLRDPERRRRYDMFGPEAARGAGQGTTDPNAFFGGGLGDLFDAFFGQQNPFGGGGGRGRAGPVQGADLEVVLELTFEEAVFGSQSEVGLKSPVTCATCEGSGASPGTSPTVCPECRGAGEVRRVRQSILGQMVTSAPCSHCRGLGRIIADPCRDCRGEGRRTEQRTYTVDVPAGVDHGSTLRLTGRGAAGPRGGPPGDLYVHLSVSSHPRFQREGYDLTHLLHLPVSQAALGTHIEFETLDGTEDLVVPSGTQTGKVFRLRGRGVPHVNSRGRGDIRVEVVVDTPTGLTDGQEELLRQLAAERGEHVAPVDTGVFSKIRSAFK
jgi:molecular chaperone DnaJ